MFRSIILNLNHLHRQSNNKISANVEFPGMAVQYQTEGQEWRDLNPHVTFSGGQTVTLRSGSGSRFSDEISVHIDDGKISTNQPTTNQPTTNQPTTTNPTTIAQNRNGNNGVAKMKYSSFINISSMLLCIYLTMFRL